MLSKFGIAKPAHLALTSITGCDILPLRPHSFLNKTEGA
jgi:hypothetical protein